MSGFETKRRMNTTRTVEVRGSGNHVTVNAILWFAREAQKAVDAGMDPRTEVRIDNPLGVNGYTIRATHVESVETS